MAFKDTIFCIYRCGRISFGDGEANMNISDVSAGSQRQRHRNPDPLQDAFHDGLASVSERRSCAWWRGSGNPRIWSQFQPSVLLKLHCCPRQCSLSVGRRLVDSRTGISRNGSWCFHFVFLTVYKPQLVCERLYHIQCGSCIGRSCYSWLARFGGSDIDKKST